MADARLKFSGENNFGRVPIFATREVRVSFQNVGRAPLRIHEVWMEDQDGAFRASFDQPGPHDLPAGDSRDLIVRFNPRRGGGFPAALIAKTDTSSERFFRVEFSGEAVDARALLGARTLDYGRIEVGSRKTATLDLQNPSDVAVTVIPKVIGADRDEFTTGPVMLGPWERRNLDIQFTPTRVGKKQVALAVAPCEGCVDEVVQVLAEGLDRAIIPEPPELDFGQVGLDRDARMVLTLRNISTEPQEVTAFALDPATDPSFTHVGGSVPVMLGGGETREFTVRYAPGHQGGAEGVAVFGIGSPRHPELRVPMYGFGGAPELCVSPPEYDFGPQPIGAKVTGSVNIKNCGSPNGTPLVITELVIGASATARPGQDQFSVAPIALPVELSAGEGIDVKIFFEPTRLGPAFGAVGVRSTGFRGSIARVELTGLSQDHLPCALTVTPMLVDFGTVPPGNEGILGVRIQNTGPDLCPVKNIRIADDGGGVFRMPGGDLDGVVTVPGYGFSFMVAYDSPPTPGLRSGALQIELGDVVTPRMLIPLIGNSQDACVLASPSHLDFGFARPDCPPAPQTVTLTNHCAAPVTLNDVVIGPGTTDGEFVLNLRPPAPTTLQPGASTTAEVGYLAQARGMNLSPLFIDVVGLGRPLLVWLLGESDPKGEQVDEYIQQDANKVDVLLVVDNTATMVEEHPKLVSAIPEFVDAVQQRGTNMNVAVTTTGIDPVSADCPGGALGGEAGRFFPVDNARSRLLTSATPNLTALLQANVQVGQCAQIERGFEAMRRALSSPLVENGDDPRTPLPNDGNGGFLRDEAALAVVFIGDEDDHSAAAVDTYLEWLRGAKGANQPGRAVIFALAPTGGGCSTAGGVGTRYAEAAAKTGGEVLSICEDDYGPLLASVASRAFAPQNAFTLSATPDGTGMTVLIDGVAQAAGWTYDAANNQVVFATTPPPGARIEIRYRRLCGT
ncbi:MAG: choice-of-anchor D domain-containing protein [Myxococcaceae bacterium]